MVDTIQPQLIAMVILFPSISTVIVALRTYVRITARQFYWDDGLILLAWALAVAHAGVIYKWILVAKFGYHIYDLDPPTIEQNVLSMKINFAQQILYNPILCLVKASIIIFLLRLDDRRRGIKWALYGLFVFNLGHMISVFVTVLTLCRPISTYWNHFYTDVALENGVVFNPRTSCIDEEKFSLITAGLAILTDVLIVCVPIVMVWNLRLGLRKKIGVAVVLSLGWVVAAVSILRFKIFYDFFQGYEKDVTYSLTQSISGIETNVAIWTACGPAMKAFITHFAPRFFGPSSSGARATNGDYYHDGYRLRERMPTTKSVRAQNRTAGSLGERDADADSQQEIMFGDSLGAKSGDVVETERELRQSDSPAAGSMSRSSSQWSMSHRTTMTRAGR